MSIVGGGLGVELDQELPAIPLAVGGALQMVTSTIFLGVGASQARSAALLYGLDVRPQHGAVITGIGLQVAGLSLAVAAGIDVANTSCGWFGCFYQDAIGLGIAGGVCLIAGHLIAQGGAGQIRQLAGQARDAESFQAARRARPAVQFSGIWAFRADEGAIVGASFLF